MPPCCTRATTRTFFKGSVGEQAVADELGLGNSIADCERVNNYNDELSSQSDVKNIDAILVVHPVAKSDGPNLFRPVSRLRTLGENSLRMMSLLSLIILWRNYG